MRGYALTKRRRPGYGGYVACTVVPALGHVSVSALSVRVLEEFYADLRRHMTARR